MSIDTHRRPSTPGRMVPLLCMALVASSGLQAEQGVLAVSNVSIGQRKGQQPSQASRPRNQPYLRVVSTPGLRFEEAEQPPAYDLEPVAYGMYHNDDYSPPVTDQARKDRPDIILPATQPKPSAARDGEEKPRGEDIPPILPDELRREVRPEEVMPFFLFPGGGAQTAPKAASPGTQPASSATYRQE